MTDPNPHRVAARTVAFLCYVLSGFVLVAGTFFTLAAATMDLTSAPGLELVTNARMAGMVASIFSIIALLISLLGRRIRRLYGQPHRQERLAAKSAVGCLRLGSLGCGLWALPSTFTVLLTGKMLATGEPAGVREIFIGTSGFLLAITLMMSVAWFISVNFVRPSLEEGRRAYHEYLNRVQPRLPGLADLATRAYVQEQTMEVLAKSDTTTRGLLLEYLSKAGLLTGATRITLQGADFRGADLHSIDLPRADLHGINLEHAKLQDAILFEADLNGARLNKADLSHANLQGADLRMADLTDAVLDGANLRGADLRGAAVTPAQLGRARLDQTRRT
jgi:Pentapeptide repeats (8 copies)